MKVRLWLTNPDENNLAHAVVLSGYLVARNLTATLEAVKIALETKKALVERELLDISYVDFERVLMECATKRGYGSAQTRTAASRSSTPCALFHAVRVPLVVVVTGTAASGKSQLSRALSQRLNITNIIPAHMMRETASLSCSKDSSLRRSSTRPPGWRCRHRRSLPGVAAAQCVHECRGHGEQRRARAVDCTLDLARSACPQALRACRGGYATLCAHTTCLLCEQSIGSEQSKKGGDLWEIATKCHPSQVLPPICD